MSRLLGLLLLLAVIGFVILFVRHDRTVASAALAADQRDQMIQHANTLATTLVDERTAQQQLRTTTDQLRADLRRRTRQIEDLKRENQELRDWAAQPLPGAAVRLRTHPEFIGAGAYRDWLSGRGAVPAAGDGAGQ